MENMKCWDCLQKHVACALSYAKEVLSGHGRGNELDHRPDLLGEVINAEHHAEVLLRPLFEMISDFRKQLQASQVTVTLETIDRLRQIFIAVDAVNDSSQGEVSEQLMDILSSFQPPNSTVSEPARQQRPVAYANIPAMDIIYESVTNLNFFRFSYNSIGQYLQHHGNVYVLHTEQQLDEFPDVTVLNKTLLEACADDRISDTFLYMKENMAWINKEDCQAVSSTYSFRPNENRLLAEQELNRTNTRFAGRVYDNIKPQPIIKEMYLKSMQPIGETTYPLTHYYTLNVVQFGEPGSADFSRIAIVDRPVCCSTKFNLRHGKNAIWNNEENFKSMLDFLKSNGSANSSVIASNN